MIRIFTQPSPACACLRVEGKLAAPWLAELEKCWRALLRETSPHAVHVHLADVNFIDERGRALLQEMAQQGVRLTADGVMTRAVVEEIMKET